MASKNTFVVFLVALFIACVMMVSTPTVEAQNIISCKTTKECAYLHCSREPGTALCVKGQCKCSSSSTHQAKLDNPKTMSYAKKCRFTSDCDPRMRFTCVSKSYMCFDGLCTCTN